MKTLVLELGGHAPFIVFDDCDLDQVVKEAIAAKFATTGQDCLGANRFYVHEKLYEQFCEKLAKATAALTIGPGLEDLDLGPLMNQSAFDKQVDQVRDAVSKGARILCGGKSHQLGGLFYEPTILADVSDDAKIMQEETFGPVAAIQSFSDEDLVTQKANATEYGLIAYLHTMDPKRIYRMTRALQFGMVAVNRSKVTGAPIPFGGFKQSGLAREGARQGLEASLKSNMCAATGHSCAQNSRNFRGNSMLKNDQLDQWDRENFFHPSTHLAQHARGESPTRIVTGGSGCHIVDREGNKLLDAFAGLYCVNVAMAAKKLPRPSPTRQKN